MLKISLLSVLLLAPTALQTSAQTLTDKDRKLYALNYGIPQTER